MIEIIGIIGTITLSALLMATQYVGLQQLYRTNPRKYFVPSPIEEVDMGKFGRDCHIGNLRLRTLTPQELDNFGGESAENMGLIKRYAEVARLQVFNGVERVLDTWGGATRDDWAHIRSKTGIECVDLTPLNNPNEVSVDQLEGIIGTLNGISRQLCPGLWDKRV